MIVAGVVLAAGGSSRLGRPKQLLPYAGTTLLGATLERVAGFGFDQVVVTPGVTADSARAVSGTGAPAAVCRYADGIGHPFWFARETHGNLRALHGDKGVWRLLESERYDVAQVPVEGPVPLDVDTLEDYLALLDATPGTR